MSRRLIGNELVKGTHRNRIESESFIGQLLLFMDPNLGDLSTTRSNAEIYVDMHRNIIMFVLVTNNKSNFVNH